MPAPMPEAARKLTDYKFAFGKRRDGSGYDVLVIDNGHVEVVGPYRLQREAREAISTGEAATKAAAQRAERPE